MNKYHIEITKRAKKNLYEIGRYIVKELLEPSISQKVVGRIHETILTLEELPLRNSLVTDKKLARHGLWKMMVDNFILFYIISEEQNTATIIRILNGRRNWIDLI
ncbi:MAG TPA: type II toxin-antitoxin system RelE/ParE family toxin [Clostridia bacterium]